MKKTTAAAYFTILVLANIAGQSSNENKIIGSWYLSNPNLIKANDTLIFNRELAGNVFSIWQFKNNNTLIISTGTIRENNSMAKCFSEVLHYNWAFISSNELTVYLEIRMGKNTDLYSMLFLDAENLKLMKIDSGFSISTL